MSAAYLIAEDMGRVVIQGAAKMSLNQPVRRVAIVGTGVIGATLS
jgi:hypothetical protein